MAAKRREPSAQVWRVVFEEMRSQNRATIEQVEMIRVSLEQRMEQEDRESRVRDTTLEMAFREFQGDVRALHGDVRAMQGDIHAIQGDVRDLRENVADLSRKVDTLVPLEARVTLLEKRLG